MFSRRVRRRCRWPSSRRSPADQVNANDGAFDVTFTAENPDYWLFEDGAWRWVQRRPDSPCFNETDLTSIEAARPQVGAESQD